MSETIHLNPEDVDLVPVRTKDLRSRVLDLAKSPSLQGLFSRGQSGIPADIGTLSCHVAGVWAALSGGEDAEQEEQSQRESAVESWLRGESQDDLNDDIAFLSALAYALECKVSELKFVVVPEAHLRSLARAQARQMDLLLKLGQREEEEAP